jgi:thiol-disulfide isomerase/thioredoxin
MRKLVIFSLLFSFLFYSCTDSKDNDANTEDLEDNFVIRGEVLGASNQPVILEAISSNGKIKLAETSTEIDGTFELKGNIKGLGLYQLTIGIQENKSIPLTLSPNESIKVKANYQSYERLPEITGASWGPILSNYMFLFNDFAIKQTELAGVTGVSQEEQLKTFFELKRPLDEYAKKIMLKYPENPANIVLYTSLTPAMGFENWDTTNLDVLRGVSKAFSKKYKSSPISNSFIDQVKQIEYGLEQFKNKGQNNTSSIAPEIRLPNPEGKILSLSSLKGKVVLIDFWASWCGPCRRENPNVVNLYSKFNPKGFEVFSVSLDSDKEAWKRAIVADGLHWSYHVSDLQQWDTPLTKLYNFNSIPHTVLIDKNGVIIGEDVKGKELENLIVQALAK